MAPNPRDAGHVERLTQPHRDDHASDMSFLDPVHAEILLRLLAALLIGGLIGLERSYHGRPAGFRTHALVCLSSSLLMLVTVYEARWFESSEHVRAAIDPTRMSQGIMTGIGFLGAGAIMKEGLSVRGLTTAASIWITAAIGILIGIGFYFPATIAAALTLGTLSAFRWIEARIPAQFYAHFYVRYARDAVVSETALRDLVKSHGFSIANLSYRLDASAGYFEYRMVIRSGESVNAAALSRTLASESRVLEFRLSPTGD
jgi:putative Mg2+ transporter-C (MgtC) family protein